MLSEREKKIINDALNVLASVIEKKNLDYTYLELLELEEKLFMNQDI